MIRYLSETLEKLLTDPGVVAPFPELKVAKIAFEPPLAGFKPVEPTVDLFLYDVRENLELRSNEPIIKRNGSQATITQPPRRIDCSYLVTAWPTGATGNALALLEHRLLGQVLRVLAGFPKIPAKFLQGDLIGQEPPLPMIAPQIDGLKSPGEFWTALGNQLRAAFMVTATIGMPVYPDVTGPIVTTKFSGFGAGEAPIDETLVQIGGRVVNAGSAPIAGAVVDVLDAGLRARTDADGRYEFGRVPRGNRNVRVVAVGFQPSTRTIPVPGTFPEDYDFTLNAL